MTIIEDFLMVRFWIKYKTNCFMEGNKIRRFEIGDLEVIMRIWLESNIKAHDFINESYWKEKYQMVKEILPKATIFVYEDNVDIQGFIGLTDNYIAGVFVDYQNQTNSIGKFLVDHVKEKYPSLSLKVYKNNMRAVKFYQRERFVIREEQIDENTNEVEYVMDWKI